MFLRRDVMLDVLYCGICHSDLHQVRKLAHLQENLWAADFQFTADELRGFTETVSRITIVGERYTGTQAQQTNR